MLINFMHLSCCNTPEEGSVWEDAHWHWEITYPGGYRGVHQAPWDLAPHLLYKYKHYHENVLELRCRNLHCTKFDYPRANDLISCVSNEQEMLFFVLYINIRNPFQGRYSIVVTPIRSINPPWIGLFDSPNINILGNLRFIGTYICQSRDEIHIAGQNIKPLKLNQKAKVYLYCEGKTLGTALGVLVQRNEMQGWTHVVLSLDLESACIQEELPQNTSVVIIKDNPKFVG